MYVAMPRDDTIFNQPSFFPGKAEVQPHHQLQSPVDARNVVASRRAPQPGEYAYPVETKVIKPMSVGNDARGLPYFATPTFSFPIVDFKKDFPHIRIPIEKVQGFAQDHQGPMLPGYGVPQTIQGQKEEALESIAPKPWVGRESVTYDISGLNGLGISLPNLGYDSALENPAVQEAVTEEAAKAEAEGAGPGVVDYIMQFGGLVGNYLLQDQAIKKQEDAAKDALQLEKLRLQREQLAAQAAQAGMPATVVQQIAPAKSSSLPWILGGAAVLGTGAFVAMKAWKK